MLAKLWQHYVLCLVVYLRHSDSYVCLKTELFLLLAFLPSGVFRFVEEIFVEEHVPYRS